MPTRRRSTPPQLSSDRAASSAGGPSSRPLRAERLTEPQREALLSLHLGWVLYQYPVELTTLGHCFQREVDGGLVDYGLPPPGATCEWLRRHQLVRGRPAPTLLGGLVYALTDAGHELIAALRKIDARFQQPL